MCYNVIVEVILIVIFIMKGNILEAFIGAVVLIIASLFIFFAYTTSGEKIKSGYTLTARFDNIGGIAVGADVKINGIKVGIVKSLEIDENYQAKAVFLIKNGMNIPKDTTAAVTTDGIMGNKFISMITGFDSEMLGPNEEIESTRSSVNLEDMIDKFVVNSAKDEPKEKTKGR